MTATLHLGTGRTLQLEAEAEIASSSLPSLSDSSIAETAATALASPLGYPPLSQCVVPGDQVALAIAEGVPCADRILFGMLTALVNAGVEPDHITLVLADAHDAAPLAEMLAGSPFAGVEIATHDPTNDEQQSFAGVTHTDREIVFNRLLLDADVKIPISCSRAMGTNGQLGSTAGVFEGLYPAFSNAQAKREALAELPLGMGANKEFGSVADQAGWLLGVTLVAQVVPGVHGGVAGVFAGPAESVSPAAERLSQELWTRRVPRRAELVIATLTGDEREQTWSNLERALSVAESAGTSDAALALCTELAEPLEESLALLLADDDPDRAALELAQSDAPAASCAAKLLAARERGPVYLMSQLDPEAVEDLGLAPVANERELSRLASRQSSCVVLEGAQHATVIVEEEGDGEPSAEDWS